MEGYYFSVKFGLLLILYTFIVGLLPLSYWHIGFLDKKFAGFKKIFIPLSSILCGRLYKTFPQKHTKG